jgi:hypothetical protein
VKQTNNFVIICCTAAALLLTTGASWAADGTSGSADQAGKTPANANADSGNGAAGASTSNSGATMPDHITLSDAEREKIRQLLAQEKTDITFNSPDTKDQKGFNPVIGEKVPAKLPLLPMPTSLARQVPAVENYGYMKLKDQVLIVNPMSKTIVDMFPERRG